MKREEILKAISDYVNSGNVKDYGRIGKRLEVLTRDYLLKDGIGSIKDCKCRTMKADDCRIRSENGYAVVEIKSGSGAVAYSELEPFTADDLIEENIMATADLVVWYPFPALAFSNDDPFRFGWMFTRNEFIDCLNNIGKNGYRSMIHITKHGYQINLQTLSAKIEDRLYDELEKVPTVKEWKERRA